MTPEFHTKSGRLTLYGLSCGYIEQTILGMHRVRLWREHNCLHVKAFDHGEKLTLAHERFTRLTAARDYFDAIVNALRVSGVSPRFMSRDITRI